MNSYQCAECDLSFGDKDGLSRHIDKQHPVPALAGEPGASKKRAKELVVAVNATTVLKHTDSVDRTLKARGEKYGEFTENARVAQQIKEAMRASSNWRTLSADKSEALDFIASKIGRILAGDTEYADSWHDIAGYAKLVEDELLSRT